jgi:hypothetical protein
MQSAVLADLERSAFESMLVNIDWTHTNRAAGAGVAPI